MKRWRMTVAVLVAATLALAAGSVLVEARDEPDLLGASPAVVRDSVGEPAFVSPSGDYWDYRLPTRSEADGRRCHPARRITFVDGRVTEDREYEIACTSTFESFDEPWTKTVDEDGTITYRPKP
jgi:hypothetical protein